MYSLNAPVPPAVREAIADLRPALSGFDTIRDGRTRTLVVKRLAAEDRREYLAEERRVREALRGAPAVEARVTGVEVFRDPPHGRGPVAYLAVESPGLRQVHDRVVDALGAIPDLEGEAYVPHVTLARGGDDRAIASLRDRSFDPVTWTVEVLEFYDARHGERIDRVSLPA